MRQTQPSLQRVSRQPTAQRAVLDDRTSVTVCIRQAKSDAELEAAANLRADAYYEVLRLAGHKLLSAADIHISSWTCCA